MLLVLCLLEDMFHLEEYTMTRQTSRSVGMSFFDKLLINVENSELNDHPIRKNRPLK